MNQISPKSYIKGLELRLMLEFAKDCHIPDSEIVMDTVENAIKSNGELKKLLEYRNGKQVDNVVVGVEIQQVVLEVVKSIGLELYEKYVRVG